MPPRSKETVEPRKTPVQARSSASVDAILEATIQVLLQIGKDRLTTTRVAARAGVSVGTLYQYFPNKSALLQAVLSRHLNAVTAAVEAVCRSQQGAPLPQMATALVTVFLEAKMTNVEASAALYAISGDVGVAKIAHQMGARFSNAIAAMLQTAPEPLSADPRLIASMLQGAMVGVSRSMLESGSPQKQLAPLRQELISLACAYLNACRTTP